MADHLPECLLPDFDRGVWVCICPELRACEQRVEEEAQDNITIASGVNYAHGYADGYGKARKVAYAAGLQAAREAVAEVPHDLTCFRKTVIGCTCTRGQALAAIDAVKP